MRVCVKLVIEDTFMVDGVDSDFAMSMNDLIVSKKDADMVDFTLFVIKECQIAWVCLRKHVQRLSLRNLLICIAGRDAAHAF
jgi:hypothetical protein